MSHTPIVAAPPAQPDDPVLFVVKIGDEMYEVEAQMFSRLTRERFLTLTPAAHAALVEVPGLPAHIPPAVPMTPLLWDAIQAAQKATKATRGGMKETPDPEQAEHEAAHRRAALNLMHQLLAEVGDE